MGLHSIPLGYLFPFIVTAHLPQGTSGTYLARAVSCVDAHHANAHHCRYLDQILSVSGSRRCSIACSLTVSGSVDAHCAHAHHCRDLDQIASVSGVAVVFDRLFTYRELRGRTVLMLIMLMLIIVGI